MADAQNVILDSVHKVFCTGGLIFRRKRTETHALKDISFSVGAGEVLALLGPNGSGKSTTLKLISTSLLPDAGKVTIKGFDTRNAASAVRNIVGLAWASERTFFPRLTARENLDFFAALDDVPRSIRAERVESLLQAAGLAGAADKQLMKLSSGMYQRLGIARALIKQPSVLLLDEPTRSLDPAAASAFWTLVRSLTNTGITILLATHNFAEAVSAADRVLILQNGECVAATKTCGFSAETLRSLYLDLTQGQQLNEWICEVPA